MTTSEYQSLYEQNLQAVVQKGYLDTEDLDLYDKLSEPVVLEGMDAIKGVFPENKERMILTNGTEFIQLSSDNNEATTTVGWKFKEEHPNATAAEFAEYYFNAAVELKKRNPAAPIYNIHNHPKLDTRTVETADALARMGIPLEDQPLIGKIPSRSDIDMWAEQANLTQGAIYVQDIDSIVSYTDDWSEAASKGTQIALDYIPAREANPLWGGDPTPAKWVPRFASAEEHKEGTVYIPFDKWDEEKDKYNIDWYLVRDETKKRL